MKIRNGFVSNSSSSSFVLMIKKDVVDQILETAHPYIKEVVNKGMFKTKMFGVDILQYSFAGHDSIDEFKWIRNEIDWKDKIPTNRECFGEGNEDDADIYDIIYEWLPLRAKEISKDSLYQHSEEF